MDTDAIGHVSDHLLAWHCHISIFKGRVAPQSQGLKISKSGFWVKILTSRFFDLI